MGDSFLKLMPGIAIEEEKVILLDRNFREEMPYYAQVEYYKRLQQN